MDWAGLETSLIFIGILLIPQIGILFLIGLVISIILDIKKRRFKFSKIALITITSTIGLIIGIFWLLDYLARPPSTKDLTENYFRHKTEFNQLAHRIQIDQKKGLERVDNDWTRPENVTTIGLSGDDIKNYRSEFGKLGIPRGFYAYQDSVDFIAYAFGLSVSGSDMGYLYSEKLPQNYFKKNCGYSLKPFKRLEDYKGCQGSGAYTIYQKIDNNWYIYDELE